MSDEGVWSPADTQEPPLISEVSLVEDFDMLLGSMDLNRNGTVVEVDVFLINASCHRYNNEDVEVNLMFQYEDIDDLITGLQVIKAAKVAADE